MRREVNWGIVNPDTTGRRPKERDLRLDFFRGLAMIIILIAHITDNPWALWSPSRFGFSDATEIFVFCSGIASALAFGAVFARAGFLAGTARVLYRVWQVYWVHLGIFLVGLLAMLLINMSGAFPRDEVGGLNLYPILRNTGPNFVGLMTLTYVPNYFDVLPMYMVILAMIPAMVALARIDPKLAILASLTLWAMATAGWLDLPAEWWFARPSTRTWFFNPFAWQLVFFTGFALVSGWIPVPPVRPWLVWSAVAVVVLSLPFAWHVTAGAVQFIGDWRRDWLILHDKTHFGLLRFGYFLALAYLAWIAVGPAGQRLTAGPRRQPLVRAVAAIGRQSLAVFAVSMVLARVLGAFLYLFGPGPLVTPAINLLGLALIWLTALGVGWIKSNPWKTAGTTAGRGMAPAPVAPVTVTIAETRPQRAAEVQA